MNPYWIILIELAVIIAGVAAIVIFGNMMLGPEEEIE